MKKLSFIGTTLFALMLLVTACSPQAAPVVAPAAAVSASTATTVVKPAGATVMLGKSDALGAFLVDGKNMTLYLFTKDTPNVSNCYDKCATAWPPLLSTGAAVAGDGVDASRLGTTKRTDGSTQVTYNGWPLYYYIKDTKPGDTIGEDVGKVWYVISPAGERVTATSTAPAAAGTTVSFSRDILPILEESCVSCHGGEKTSKGLDLKSYASIMAGSQNGAVITAGNAESSKLVSSVLSGKMPKRGAKLTAGQIKMLVDWVNAGAENN